MASCGACGAAGARVHRALSIADTLKRLVYTCVYTSPLYKLFAHYIQSLKINSFKKFTFNYIEMFV